MTEEVAGYQFDGIILDIKNRQLSSQGKLLSLNAKYFEVLLYLVEHHSHLVTKDELFHEIWSDVIVTDWALSQCIKDIRKVLKDNARNPRYIRTFPKHGFMFIGKPLPLTAIKTDLHSGEEFYRRPFKFLDYYTESDIDLFYGRESEVTNLCSKILTHRSFVLYGRSGVGKSSIVHAGILPALKKQGHQVLVIRNYHDGNKEILKLHSTRDSRDSNDGSTTDYSADSSNNRDSFIMIFDQFEEYFLRTVFQTREEFLLKLKELLDLMGNYLKLVFVIREDLFAEMDSFKEVLPEIFHHVYRLLKLSPAQAFQAIIEPGRRVNCQIEEALASAIIKDLSEKESIDPPQLQIVCDALFDKRDVKSHISLDIYNNLGGAAVILSNYLDRVMHRFHSDETEKVKQILKTLVSEDHQRLLLEKSVVLKNVGNRNMGYDRVELILKELENARVIRFQRENEGIFVELTHDFLVDEITKWYSEEEIFYNRTKAIFDSAYQNYQSHRLLMDEDFLELVLPVGERMVLDNQQSEFLGQCLINRKKSLPDWLMKGIDEPLKFIEQYIRNDDEGVRIAALESLLYLDHPDLRHILSDAALWDENLSVRKSAGIMLVKKYGEDSLQIINDKTQNKRAGVIRRAVTLALIRDHQGQLFKPGQLSFFLAFIVFGGLAWVRLRRARFYILQQTIGGSLGAAFSGICVGLCLGLILVFYRNLPAYESTTLVLVLTSLGMITGLLVGMGISIGMTAMRVISYRHHPVWSVIGAVIGGASIGGILHLLGVDTFLALFGQKLSNIAGAYEGALVGLGLSLGASIGSKIKKHSSWLSILFAACGSMLVAILLTFIEGNLFSASIESIARSFVNSQIRFEALANLFGEAYFGQVSRLILGAFEGFMFGGCTILGIELFARRKWGDLFPEY